MNSFQLEILAADCPFFKGECESLVVPTEKGLYGIWANHSGMALALCPGTISFRPAGQEMQSAFVSQGLVQVENNKVLVLVDSAEHPEEIDTARAKKSAADAKEAMLQKRSAREYHLAQARLARALARLKTAGHFDKTLE